MRPSRHYELVSVRYLTFEDGPTDVRFRWLRYRLALRTMDADTAARKPNRAPSILDAGPDFVETDRMAYVSFPLAGLMKVVLPRYTILPRRPHKSPRVLEWRAKAPSIDRRKLHNEGGTRPE